MNDASEAQLISVAQSCKHFHSVIPAGSSKLSTKAENISCDICTNWDGQRCVIDVFDSVLASLDQT